MIRLISSIFLVLFTISAYAATYDVDRCLDDYIYTNVGGSWVYTAGDDPVTVVGQIVTVGTLGDITFWSLTISSTTGSQQISSVG